MNPNKIKTGPHPHSRTNPVLLWRYAVRKKKELIFGPTYQKYMYDEAMMAIVFKYNIPLLEKILQVSSPSEVDDVLTLFSSQIVVETSLNGNIVIHN